MKMHPSHRPCPFTLAALPARSRTIDLRGNVTHTGNLGPVPKVFGARGSVDFGASFTIKLARFISYTAAAYGGFSAGWEASKEYKKQGSGPWVLVKEESGWGGEFHVHIDAGFASYDYSKVLF